MPRPIPTPVLHFTHIDHLPTVLQHGLMSDTEARARELVRCEVGHRGIKERRRDRVVPVEPGGVVADYVPFYFAQRSPMMFVIAKGGVPEYAGGTDPLIYLVSTVERLLGLRRQVVSTDRNAVLDYATFLPDVRDLEEGIDWGLMRARMWNDTVAEPDRKERRMAECLVHRSAPWAAFTEIHVRNEERRTQVVAALRGGAVGVPVHVTPDWYF